MRPWSLSIRGRHRRSSCASRSIATGGSPTEPDEAIDLSRAVRAACLDPAQVAHQPELGRLVPGCRADLIVVPDMGLREGSDALVLASTRPLATMLDGEVVYRSADFDA